MKISELTKGLPIEFEDMMSYCWALKFEDWPDYGYLRKMMGAIFFRANFVNYTFDWKLLNVLIYLITLLYSKSIF